MRWICHPSAENQIEALRRQFSLHPIVARLLVRLGFDEEESAQRYLEPSLKDLDDPFRMTHLDRAVDRLQRAMRNGEDILVYGDYDVDGVTSTVLLVSILRLYGIFPRYMIPRRLQEGYGLSSKGIERILEGQTPNLLIVLDSGTNAYKEVAILREKQIDVIIIDHHSSKDGLPSDCILVNPRVFDDEKEPWQHLCTVGLVFKLVHGLLKRLRQEGDEQAHNIRLRDYLDLVAMGTVADLVPLQGENRILAKAGLERLRNTQRLGLKALYETSRMSIGEEITPVDISFRLGPRINASGRLGDAILPVDLLLCDNWGQCGKVANTLEKMNSDRKEIESRICMEAEEIIKDRLFDQAGYILHHADWHPGVVGAVASRLVQKYRRPCIVMGADGGLAKGSGRSVKGVNLVEVLQTCDELLHHWGGHPMAIGISLSPANLDALQVVFHKAVCALVEQSTSAGELELACWIQPEEINGELLDELKCLQPFGQGNPEPVFGIREVTLNKRPDVFPQGNYRFQINTNSGQRLFGVAWKKADNLLSVNEPVDLAVKLKWNCWNGRKYPQMELIDWRPSQDS